MGIFAKLRQRLTKALNPRAIEAVRIQQSRAWDNRAEPDQRALTDAELTHDVVWRCMAVKAEDQASVPLRLFEGTKQDHEEIDDDEHPALAPWRHPAPDVGESYFRQQISKDIDSAGDFFAFTYLAGGLPISFQRFRPQEITPEPDLSGRRNIGSYTWDTNDAGGVLGRGHGPVHGEGIPWEQMLHIRTPNPRSNLRGMGVVARLRYRLWLDEAMHKWELNHWLQGIPTEYIIFYRGQLSESEHKKIMQDLRRKFGGPDGDRFILVQADGEGEELFKFAPFPRPTEDELATLEKEQRIVYRIAMAMGVPPNKLMDFSQASLISNAEAMERVYWEDTIRGIHSLIEDYLNSQWLRQWFPGQQLFFAHDYSKVRALQQSAQEQATINIGYVNVGILNRNEARILIGQPPVADPMMDAYLFNGRPLGTVPDFASAFRDQTERQRSIPAAKILALPYQKQLIQEPLLDLQEERDIFERLVQVKLRAIAARAGRQHLEVAGITGVFDLSDPDVVEFIRTQTVRLSEAVVMNTNEMVRARIAEGYSEGTSVSGMRELLQSAFEERREAWQLDRIARTEAHQAQEGAAWLASMQNNVEMKRWITARDSKVRGLEDDDDADHAGLEDMGPIPMEAAFIDPRNGDHMMFPGDRTAGALGASVINCRCTWTASFEHLELAGGRGGMRKGLSNGDLWAKKADTRASLEADLRRTVKSYLLGMERRALARFDDQVAILVGPEGAAARGGAA